MMVARSGSGWMLAPALVKLVEEVDAAHPGRSTASDGSIGDASHSARASDHNPDSRGLVTAVDLTHDPGHGVDAQALFDHLGSDSRCEYTIHHGMIRSKSRGLHTYTGSNPHNHHVHVSVTNAGASDTRPWLGGVDIPTLAEILATIDFCSHGTFKRGDHNACVGVAQNILRVKFHQTCAHDEVFGPATEEAVKTVQRWMHHPQTGVVDADTWKILKA